MVKKNASVAKKVNTMNQSFRTPNEITNSPYQKQQEICTVTYLNHPTQIKNLICSEQILKIV